MIRRTVGVDYRGPDIGMAHQLFDYRTVDALHDQMTGKCVAKSVNSGEVLDLSFRWDCMSRSCNLV